MKFFAGVKGAYKMLGREGENKNCLLWMGLGSSRIGLNDLIRNWCIGGSWFTPATKLGFCETEMSTGPRIGLGLHMKK